MKFSESYYDVLIVGAGISGIGNAYWLKKKCPDKKIAILEARQSIGGTWSLFKYPGIRSDSDIFTFGYRFKPWTNPQSLSGGDDILNYLKDTAHEHKLDELIHFNHKMVAANWSDDTKSWWLDVDSSGGDLKLECKFLSICTEYYDYKEAHRPEFEGEDSFQGKIIIPQFWPENLKYQHKKIAVIGSGATAVTIVPTLAEKGAEHVTMIQRSHT